MALLLLLLFFLHWIPDARLQYFPQPQLFAFPAVTTESDRVEISCNAPVHKYECYFYPEGQNTNIKTSGSCQLSLRASEIIKWTNQSSPGPIKMICYYVLSESNRTPSPHSAPVPVIQYIKPILSVSYHNDSDEVDVACEIPKLETSSDDFRCFLYAGEDRQFFQESKSRRNRNGNGVCTFTVQKNSLTSRLQSVNSPELSCDYWVKSNPHLHSAMSDKFNMNRFFPVQTQPSVTKEESITASPVSSTKGRAAANLKPELTGTYDHQLDEFSFKCETLEPESGHDFTCFLYTVKTAKHFLKKQSERKESGHAVCSFTVQKNDLINRLQREKSQEVISLFPKTTRPPPTEEKSTAASPVVSTHLTTEGGTVTARIPKTTRPPPTEEKSTAGTTISPPTKSTPATTTRTRVTHKDHYKTTLTTPGAAERTRASIFSTVATRTSVTLNHHDRPSDDRSSKTLLVLLSVMGVGVFLSVVMIACFCKWIAKQRTKRRRLNLSSENQISMMPMTTMDKPESGADEINTPVASLPPASQLPGYMEPSYTEVLDNSTFYSMSNSTTPPSVAAPAEPSGPGRNKKEKPNKAPEEDVYHLYSTIPDLEVKTKAQDQTYSLLQMH